MFKSAGYTKGLCTDESNSLRLEIDAWQLIIHVIQTLKQEVETQPHWINEILDEDTSFVMKNPLRQKTNKQKNQEEQDDVSNLQPVEMRSWLYGCKVPSCNLTVLSVTFTDTTWHTKHVSLHKQRHNAFLTAWQNLFSPPSGSTPRFHAADKSHLSAGGCYCCPHSEPKKKVEKPFHKTQTDVQVCSLLFFLTYFTPCWVWACQMGTDYLWSPWWFDPRSCSAAAFRHKPGRQGLKVTCWQSTIH